MIVLDRTRLIAGSCFPTSGLLNNQVLIDVPAGAAQEFARRAPDRPRAPKKYRLSPFADAFLIGFRREISKQMIFLAPLSS